MFAKIRLQLHSTVHVSGVEKYLPLRSADFFALLTLLALLLSVHQWLRSAIRDSQQPTFPISFLFLKPRRAERRPNDVANDVKK